MKVWDAVLRDSKGDSPAAVAFICTLYLVMAAIALTFVAILVFVTHGIAALVGGALYALYRFIKRQVVKARADA